jgi:hypothetical protein
VRVPLRHDLADEDRVGAFRLRPGDEVWDRDLGAEVHDSDLPVGLQALLPRVALDVEYRVNADGVSVGPYARANDDELAAKAGANAQVYLRRRQQRELPLGDRHLGQVDQV